MKILKKMVWWTFKCRNCESQLEAEPNDVLMGSFGGSYCETGDTKFYVICPCCGHYNFVPEKKLTIAIMGDASKRSSVDTR